MISILVIFGFCAIASQAFLFSHKYKDACDPNPCKNKAQCVLDPKNKNISTCVCPTDYTGKHCELKTGCSTKPCKKGACVEDKVDRSKFTCVCPVGVVGQKCDTTNPCTKNPCKIGKCVVDDKLKAVCECPTGFTGSKCDKRNCTIVQFSGKNFEKKPKVYVDQTILKKFNDLDALAKICGVRVEVSRSFSLQPNINVTASTTDAPFYIGRGLQIQVNDDKGKLICNSVCLGKIPIPVQPAKCLIDGLMAIGLKHSVLNPGVIHDGFHLLNNKEYNALKEFKQVGCKDMKF